MRTPATPSTILVTEAAKMASLGPRRFRQLAGLETEGGKSFLELAYVGGRAAINREKAMAVIAQIRAARGSDVLPRHAHLGRFAEQCVVDPDTGERLCIEESCGAPVQGRGKLCTSHSAVRAARRAAARRGRSTAVAARG